MFREEPWRADAEGAARDGGVPGNGKPRGTDKEGAAGAGRVSGDGAEGRAQHYR